VDENPPRQDAERALDDAHVLVQHQVMDVGAVEQRTDRRHQHHVVGPNQFPQYRSPLRDAACPCRMTWHFLLSPSRIANAETGVAVIVPFESPSGASIEALVALVAADMERVN